jgi:uncharacterized membrane protein
MRATSRVLLALLIALAIIPAIDRTIVLLHPGGRASWDMLTRFVDYVHQFRPDIAAISRDEIALLDTRYAAHPSAALWHVIPGAVFLIGACLQFSTRFRNRHLALHRILGRVLLGAVAVSALTGIYFGAIIPLAGAGEISSTAVFGVLLLVAIVRAIVAIRRGDVVRHRHWMIRAFAVAVGVAVIRVVAAVMAWIEPLTIRDIIGPSFWSGWLISVAAAELWIRYLPAASRMDAISRRVSGIDQPSAIT